MNRFKAYLIVFGGVACMVAAAFFPIALKALTCVVILGCLIAVAEAVKRALDERSQKKPSQ